MVENIITTISREASWYRPYNANGKTLESIVIYKDGEILIKTRSGWLEERTENLDSVYNGDLIEISFDGSVKRANKLNLDRKDNFIFKMKDQYSIHDGYTLFIYADNIFSEYKETPKKYDDKKQYYLYGYSVKMKYSFKQYEMYFKYYDRGEKIEEQDKKRDFHNVLLRDENGKPKRTKTAILCVIQINSIAAVTALLKQTSPFIFITAYI